MGSFVFFNSLFMVKTKSIRYCIIFTVTEVIKMDVVRIGKFLSELRKEKNLTQEQLGEKIGVTNKTVSRWENGNYMPPVEMLLTLSEFYGVSINEILSGERLDEKGYKEKAEAHIAEALNNSVFTLKDKIKFFKKKWRKEHCFEMILEALVLIAIEILGAIFYGDLMLVGGILCIVWSFWTNNRMSAYVERHVYEERNDIPEMKKEAD